MRGECRRQALSVEIYLPKRSFFLSVVKGATAFNNVRFISSLSNKNWFKNYKLGYSTALQVPW